MAGLFYKGKKIKDKRENETIKSTIILNPI
jgi:hypothetical protein